MPPQEEADMGMVIEVLDKRGMNAFQTLIGKPDTVCPKAQAESTHGVMTRRVAFNCRFAAGDLPACLHLSPFVSVWR